MSEYWPQILTETNLPVKKIRGNFPWVGGARAEVEVNVLFVRTERLNSMVSFFVYGTKFAEHSPVLLGNKRCLDTFTREV